MFRSSLYLVGLAGAVGLAMACAASASDDAPGERGAGVEGPSSGPTGSGGGSEASGDSSGDVDFGNPGAGGGSAAACGNPPSEDGDNDGFTGLEGDCNDCDPNVNPGAIDVIVTEAGEDGNVPEPADEDCDGQIDNIPQACDDTIALTDVDPLNGAKAIDICQTASAADKKWGLLNAAYVRANGKSFIPSSQIGVFDGFGPNVNVQNGKRLLALSSGRARLPGQPGACGSLSCYTAGAGAAPPGFPQDVPSCPGAKNINDDVGLEVRLRAPTNATGYSFYFDFYSFEFPEYVCTSYNDQFIALVSPEPAGSIDGNISFDVNNNPVSVNIAFFEVCEYNPFYPQFPCALGSSALQGTGFDSWDDGGATSWLKTTAPVGGGDEVTIRFAIWDTGDQAWDSTVLVDNFQWIASGGVNVGTVVVPDPK